MYITIEEAYRAYCAHFVLGDPIWSEADLEEWLAYDDDNSPYFMVSRVDIEYAYEMSLKVGPIL